MATFRYEALDAKRNKHEGIVEAGSSEEAIELLRIQGLFPTKLQAQAQASEQLQEQAQEQAQQQDHVSDSGVVGEQKSGLRAWWSKQIFGG